MEDKALQKLLTLAPGEFHRMHSGYFQGLPRGDIAFLPTIFHLPWHSKKPRIVGHDEISKILKAELTEILVLIIFLLTIIHFFFFDIIDFYMNIFDGNLLLSALSHTITMIIFIILALLLNNIPFAWIRGHLISNLPIAGGALTSEALSKWHQERKLWVLSLTNDTKAASLRPWGVMFYIILFCISMPIFSFIIVYTLINERLSPDNISIITLFIVHGTLSIWGFIESIAVLKRRVKAAKERVTLQKTIERLEKDRDKDLKDPEIL